MGQRMNDKMNEGDREEIGLTQWLKNKQRILTIQKINKMLEPLKLHLCWITQDGNPEPLEYGLADEDGDEIDIASVLQVKE